jgi:replicative DNA helicase
LVVDTIDAIPAKYFNGEYDRQNFVTNELKALANRHKMIVIAISHISKGASYRLKEGHELDVHSAKGNSVIEQKADKIIAFESDRDNEDIRRITAIGSRDESSFKLILNFDYNTFNFKQVN